MLTLVSYDPHIYDELKNKKKKKNDKIYPHIHHIYIYFIHFYIINSHALSTIYITNAGTLEATSIQLISSHRKSFFVKITQKIISCNVFTIQLQLHLHIIYTWVQTSEHLRLIVSTKAIDTWLWQVSVPNLAEKKMH